MFRLGLRSVRAAPRATSGPVARRPRGQRSVAVAAAAPLRSPGACSGSRATGARSARSTACGLVARLSSPGMPGMKVLDASSRGACRVLATPRRWASSAAVGEDELRKRLNAVQDAFAEARDELSDAAESVGTVYYDEDVEAATAAVEGACTNTAAAASVMQQLLRRTDAFSSHR